MITLGPKHTIASIDVDVQNGFTPLCPNELPVPMGNEIANALNQQAAIAGFRIGSKDAHPEKALWVAQKIEDILTPTEGLPHSDVRWPVHCVPGTLGFELIKGLPHPAEYDFFVWKGIEPDMHPYGACFHDLKEKLSTGLIEYLHYKGVETVIVGGLATDYCVKNTVLQLLNAGFKTIVHLEACKGIAIESTQLALELMQKKGAILIQSLKELQSNA